MTALVAPDYRTTLTPRRHCAGCWFLNDDAGRSVAVIRRAGGEWVWSLSTAGRMLAGPAELRAGTASTLRAAVWHLRAVVFAERWEK